jgi:hypothetical protein
LRQRQLISAARGVLGNLGVAELSVGGTDLRELRGDF